MKEVTEWNGKPRWMWVWDSDENLKGKVYVVCILTEEEMLETGRDYPVRALDSAFKHCAEIEEPTKRPCTKEELVEMLKKQGLPMLMSGGVLYTIENIQNVVAVAYSHFTYKDLCENFTLLDGTELWVEE